MLRKAAALLLEDAAAEEGSCAVGEKLWACPDCKKEWDGKCPAQRHVEERRQVSAWLVALARTA